MLYCGAVGAVRARSVRPGRVLAEEATEMSVRAVGIDLGGTNLRAALLEFSASGAALLAQRKVAVGEARDPKSVADALVALVRALAPEESLPVGIGAAAMLRGDSGVIANAPNLGWREVPFGALVAEHLGRPVWLENDLNAILWGEQCFGGARGCQHVLCVFVGTGVGGAATEGGRLLRGAANVALEIGHTKVVFEGAVCGCGQRGCVEAYAGGRQLGLAAQQLDDPLLLALVDGERGQLHAGHLDQAARAGSSAARGLIEVAAGHLGMTLANAVTQLNPECLLMGGTVWEGCPLFAELARQRFEATVGAAARQSLVLADATLGDNAGVMGAAALALSALGGEQTPAEGERY